MPPRMPGTHWKRFEMQEWGEALYLIAWLDDLPVGHLLLRWDESAAAGSGGTGCPTLSDIAVHPAHQSRGIGSQLMDQAELLAIQRGCRHVELNVAVDNVRARWLYERRGYQGCGSDTHRSRWPYLDERGQERWHEETCMRLVKLLVHPENVDVLGEFRFDGIGD